MMTSPRDLRKIVLEVLPPQGGWSEEEYLWLTDHTTRLIEFSNGYIEVLPMPTDQHQGIVGFFYTLFLTYLQNTAGVVRFAPLRLRLQGGRYREPDLLLLLNRDDPRRGNDYWQAADLVLEIVSPDNPGRDLVVKRQEYADVGIPEYWIVNPLNQTITVLTLHGDRYVEHGIFADGAQASSVLLPGFSVDVNAVFTIE